MNKTAGMLLQWGFQTESFLASMAPIDLVIASLCDYDDSDEICAQNDKCSLWATFASQQKLAELVVASWYANYGQPHRYLRRLIRRYVSKIEALGSAELSDEIMEAMILASTPPTESLKKKLLSSPCFSEYDPNECGHVTFLTNNSSDDKKEVNVTSRKLTTLKMRVFPQHNDVAVMKVWEAGSCLAEYFMDQPHLVSGKRVVELGAGLGFTGLILSGLCDADHVQITDYTPACLENLRHNLYINKEWLEDQRDSGSLETLVGSSYLEWDAYANGIDPDIDHGIDTYTESLTALSQADILIGADICYLVELLPSLVLSIYKFLTLEPINAKSRCAILATTLRNKSTFDKFEGHLHEKGITVEFVDPIELSNLPRHFPLYYVQPRSDIRICTLTIKK